MRKRIYLTLSAVCFFGGLATPVQAGPYIGASWGAYRVNESELDDHDDLWKAYVGGTINDVFGVEASWVDFNKARSGAASFDADGWGLSAIFNIPLGPASSVFLKAGQFWWDSNSVLGGLARSRDGNDPFFGAGLRFGAGLALRLEWERYKVTNIDIDTYTVGLQLGF